MKTTAEFENLYNSIFQQEIQANLKLMLVIVCEEMNNHVLIVIIGFHFEFKAFNVPKTNRYKSLKYTVVCFKLTKTQIPTLCALSILSTV